MYNQTHLVAPTYPPNSPGSSTASQQFLMLASLAILSLVDPTYIVLIARCNFKVHLLTSKQ